MDFIIEETSKCPPLPWVFAASDQSRTKKQILSQVLSFVNHVINKRISVLQIIEWENIVTITPFTLWYQYRQESLCHSYLYCIYSNEKLLVYSNNEIVQLEEKRIDNSIFHNKFICLFPNFLLCVIQLTHSCWLIKQKLQKFISFIHELWIMIIYLFQIMSFTKYRK